MKVFDETATRTALSWPALIDTLRETFREGCEAPAKHEHFIEIPGEPDAKLLLMPAWRGGDYIAVKVAALFPGNAVRGQAAVNASVLLLSAASGEVLASIEGGELTARRTAAASVLAADYLARTGAKHLLVIGTGRIAANLAEAYRTVRPIERVTFWGRDPAKAGELAEACEGGEVATDLAAAVAAADIVTTATLARTPVLKGDWLAPGTHVDLIGNYAPDNREADDAVMRRGTVFIDDPATLKKSGDLLLAIKAGALAEGDIAADLAALCTGAHEGRADEAEVTVFKSAGIALEDYAAAKLVYDSALMQSTR